MAGTRLGSGQGIVAIGAKLTNYKDLDRESLAVFANRPCVIALRMDGFPACVYYENTVHGGVWRSNPVEKAIYLHEPGRGAKLEIHTVRPDPYSMDEDTLGSVGMTSEQFLRLPERQQWRVLWSMARQVQSKYIGEVTAGLPPEVASRYYMQQRPQQSQLPIIGRQQRETRLGAPAERLLFEARKAVVITGLDSTAEVEYMVGLAHEKKLVTEAEISSGTPGSSIGGVVLT